ncbi:helix-turn-helix domain-containing protein [Streptomyces sp. NBC_00158]|uniref:helix-turn-helix domain-containing protein n=1 Tax=Streptomyces sp. NBC_00158 TaxID=2903627 RepID=UPI00324B6EA8
MSQGELVPREPRRMVFQKDVDRLKVGPERHALAVALRELAQRLGLTLSRYAARVLWDRSTLSRFFSGVLVPQADFVEQLIEHGDQATGVELTPTVRAHVRELHRAALRAANPLAAELQELRDELAQADRESVRLKQEVRLLQEVVRTAHEKLDEQQAQLRKLENAGAADRLVHRAEMVRWSSDFEALSAERNELLETIAGLTAQLADAERRAWEAEARCADLEEQLELAEDRAEGREAEEDAGRTADATAVVTTSGDSVSFAFGIDAHLGRRLADSLLGQEPVPLTEEGLRGVLPRPGVFQLTRRVSGWGDELLYVGKTDFAMQKRLDRLRVKILGRKHVSSSELFFSYVYIEDDMSVIAPERLVIKQLSGWPSWNNNGFGNSDPGRARDLVQLKEGHFDLLHPIDLDWPFPFDPTPRLMTVRHFADYLKSHLPYRFRFKLDPGREADTIKVPAGLLTADAAFRLLARHLGNAWQITALAGYVILYEEHVAYPNAVRYYCGEDVLDVEGYRLD